MEPNPKVKIISDSTCDLSQELTAKYDIDILPLHILLGENEFRDGKDITPERIFAWADANNAENLCAVSGGCQGAAAAVCRGRP